MNPNQPLDFHARQAALDIRESYAVSAPAGSGKTGLLTQRLIKLITHCESPEEVLAITFTRKAAGEMQDRVLKALWHAKENPQFDQTENITDHDLLTWQLAQKLLAQDKIREWHLLESPHRLRVQTIDSLCARISQQLPLSNGIGGQLQTADQADSLYREAIHQLFDELEADALPDVANDLSTLLNHFDNNFQTLENLLSELLAKRDQWLSILFAAQHSEARAYLESVLRSVIEDHLKKLRQSLGLFSSELFLIIDWATQNLLKSMPESPFLPLNTIRELPSHTQSELSSWQMLADFLLTNEGSFRKSLTKNHGFPAKSENKSSEEYKNRLLQWMGEVSNYDASIETQLAEVRTLPYATYSEPQWILLDALTRLLPRLAARLDLVFAARGEADFIAVSQAALKALGDEESPTDFALQLDYQIKHILVDEFQDTALPQLQLLERLTAGWQAGDGRSLFIVGDGMQSCYSFRNANVGLFLRARQSGIGSVALKPLDLSVNFRSQAGIVDWVNSTFTQAFPNQNDINRGAVSYSISQAFRPSLPEPAVNLYLSGYTKSAKSDAKEPNENMQSDEKYLAEVSEAEAVANLVVQLKQQNPADSIAILARTRNQLPMIFSAMQARGLRWQSTDINRLADKPCIIDLMSLLSTFLHWDDRIAWLSILRAPWCGLCLDDLHKVAHAKFNSGDTEKKQKNFIPILNSLLQAEKIAHLSEHAQHSLKNLVEVILPALENRSRKSIRQSLEGIWLALGGPASLASADEIQDVSNFFLLIDKFDRGGKIEDWQSVQSAVQELYATPQSDADPLLQVMTLHKSKGLEFDQVIIPCLHKTSNSDKNKLLLWREIIQEHTSTQLLISPVNATGDEKDALYHYLKEENKLQQSLEATRLFYVGCTRAIKKLYLFASLQQDESGQWKAPSANSLLGSIWASEKENAKSIEAIASPLGYNSTNNFQADKNQSYLNEKNSNSLTRFSKDWIHPEFPTSELLSRYRGHEYNDDENIPERETPQSKLARVSGVVIHSALAILATNPLPTNLDNWIAKQSPFWSILLSDSGLDSDQIKIALKKVEAAIRQMMNDPKGRWLLDCSHNDSACEHSMMTAKNTQNEFKLREHIIDRTFIEGDVRWIIDYKTSEPSENETLTEFIATETSNYRPQLERYRKCFVAQPSQNIKLALYFPLIPAWVEI